MTRRAPRPPWPPVPRRNVETTAVCAASGLHMMLVNDHVPGDSRSKRTTAAVTARSAAGWSGWGTGAGNDALEQAPTRNGPLIE